PEQFRHFGIAYGHGIVANLGRRPWLTFLVPALLASFVRAARRVEADLLHAHWLSAGWVAAKTGKPYVVQVWGTDVELARRAPWLARRVLRGARLVIAASNDLAESARALGAREVRVIPSGVELPAEIGTEAEPPEVLYAGRLSPEKGLLELVEGACSCGLLLGRGHVRNPGGLLRGCSENGRVKRALITGIGGQDGSILAELLLEHGYEVAGLVRPGADPYPNLDGIQDRVEL